MEQEQHGATRAGYGEELIIRLSGDLQSRFERGFGRANLFQMRAFYLAYREILQIASGQLAPAAHAGPTTTGTFTIKGWATSSYLTGGASEAMTITVH